jgi:hypothetical protein
MNLGLRIDVASDLRIKLNFAVTETLEDGRACNNIVFCSIEGRLLRIPASIAPERGDFSANRTNPNRLRVTSSATPRKLYLTIETSDRIPGI